MVQAHPKPEVALAPCKLDTENVHFDRKFAPGTLDSLDKECGSSLEFQVHLFVVCITCIPSCSYHVVLEGEFFAPLQFYAFGKMAKV